MMLTESTKTIVWFAHGDEKTIIEEIDNLKNELEKGQRSTR